MAFEWVHHYEASRSKCQCGFGTQRQRDLAVFVHGTSRHRSRQHSTGCDSGPWKCRKVAFG